MMISVFGGASISSFVFVSCSFDRDREIVGIVAFPSKIVDGTSK
jgi:hypothetical protein